mgnify:CR=1 FL=1
MLRNYLAAAIGNIGRNGLYAGITVLGLSVSFAAVALPVMSSQRSSRTWGIGYPTHRMTR